MSLRSPEIQPDEITPFSKCVLGRERYAEILSKIVRTYSDGMVLALDNPWGTGKTTFVRMWRQSLENEGLLTVYFNAWENDFEQDALTSILAELGELAFFKDENKDSFNDLVKKAGPLVKKLIPTLVKAFVKKHTDDEFTAELFDGAAEVVGEGLSKSMNAYAAKKKGLKDFKDRLAELLSKVEERPLVFFIDELDRCRPDYAVHTLEVMKHFFDVRGIVFILSIDKKQLEHAVRGVYGNDNMDATEYLRRFIDLEYSLPKPTNSDFIKHLYKSYNLSGFFESKNRLQYTKLKEDGQNLINIANILFKEMGLTLRQQEKVFINLKVTLLAFKENSFVFPEVLLMLLLIRQKDYSFFKEIALRKLAISQLQRKLRALFPESVESSMERALTALEARFILTYNNSLNYEAKEILNRPYEEESDSNPKSLFRTSGPEELGELIKSFALYHEEGDLRITWLTEKIDLLAELSKA